MIEVIANGRPATQMPDFNQTINAQDIAALADYALAPPDTPPAWRDKDILDSRRQLSPPAPNARPLYDADPLNLILVVEKTDHHISVLDGDRLEVIRRFQTLPRLHGGPKFSPAGRYVYLASRDGWIEKHDLYRFKPLYRVRAGINTRNIAVSADGRYVAVANYLPHSLVILDGADLSLLKVIPAQSEGGKPSRVSAVYQAAPHGGFIAAMKDIAEVWQIDAKPGFALRKIPTDAPIEDFFFIDNHRYLIGANRAHQTTSVIDLASGKTVAKPPLAGMPHLGSGVVWQRDGRRLLATPNLKTGQVVILDTQNWQPLATLTTDGPGFFARSHPNSRYAWVDVFFGPHKARMHVIDKQTLKIAKTLTPAPGKTSAHVEFDRYGKYALASIWHDDGAVVIYDAETLQEVKRLPMKKPSGKYNVYNKISRLRSGR